VTFERRATDEEKLTLATCREVKVDSELSIDLSKEPPLKIEISKKSSDHNLKPLSVGRKMALSK
jgi:hypothetical protein